jgi:hypothetical protein
MSFCFGFGMGPLCAAQAGLELAILLPQLPECWDYRRESLAPNSYPFLSRDGGVQHFGVPNGCVNQSDLSDH